LVCFTACLQVLGFVSPPIDEALTFRTLDGFDSAHVVINLEASAIVVTEVELTKVALEMFGADVVIGAGDAALEDREIALDRFGVNVAAHLLIEAEIDDIMTEELFAYVVAMAGFLSEVTQSLFKGEAGRGRVQSPVVPHVPCAPT
jgi:hypothetical protein